MCKHICSYVARKRHNIAYPNLPFYHITGISTENGTKLAMVRENIYYYMIIVFHQIYFRLYSSNFVRHIM